MNFKRYDKYQRTITAVYFDVESLTIEYVGYSEQEYALSWIKHHTNCIGIWKIKKEKNYERVLERCLNWSISN